MQEKSTIAPGISHGTWNGIPGLDKVIFPNAVVDVGVGADGSNAWMIEFQCVDGPKFLGQTWVAFYAFNFYAKTYHNADVLIPEMEAAMRAQGLGAFIDSGNQIKVLDHTNCLLDH